MNKVADEENEMIKKCKNLTWMILKTAIIASEFSEWGIKLAYKKDNRNKIVALKIQLQN